MVPKTTVSLFIVFLLFFGILPAKSFAASYDLKAMTPEVEQALMARKGRFERLSALKAAGTIGENNRGYVTLLSTDASLEKVVSEENRDRKTIYQTIANQNGIEDEISTIEKVFANVQREKAGEGEKIQLENGEWTSK